MERWEANVGNRVSWADGSATGVVREIRQLSSDASASGVTHPKP